MGQATVLRFPTAMHPHNLNRVFRHGAGFVAKSNSKHKARCSRLTSAQSGPVDPRDDLSNRFLAVPGLDCHSTLLSGVFASWQYFGEMTDELFHDLLEALPQKRPSEPGDLRDAERLDGMHVRDIEEMRKDARAEALRRLREILRMRRLKLLEKNRPLAASRSWTRKVD